MDDLMAYVVGATIWHGLDSRREFDNVFADGEEAIHLPVPHWSLLRWQWLQPVAGPEHSCCSQENPKKLEHCILHQYEFKGWIHLEFLQIDTIEVCDGIGDGYSSADTFAAPWHVLPKEQLGVLLLHQLHLWTEAIKLYKKNTSTSHQEEQVVIHCLHPPLTSHRQLAAASSGSSCSLTTTRGAMVLPPWTTLSGSCSGCAPEVTARGAPARLRCRRTRRRGTADASTPGRSSGCGSRGTLNRRPSLAVLGRAARPKPSSDDLQERWVAQEWRRAPRGEGFVFLSMNWMRVVTALWRLDSNNNKA